MLKAQIPSGYTHVTPYLVVRDVPRLIEFLVRVLDAEPTVQAVRREDGSVMHAEVAIGGARIMMGEPMDGGDARPATLYIYVDDADARYARGLDAGGKSLMEPADQPHGDRYGGVEDPTGNRWYMAQHLQDEQQEAHR